ncbi:SgcJ/EcaC family oxidoreductase [Rhizobium sp. NZLR1b]|uniref:YybH family protein n=1 Tax=Rhizobium sp. NZLR1b TaxID=2731099 RepID=UPI001C83C3EC|nr:SgcJ/EcaC family oxidoreductase [Rhizobium sp. NZLR1b]MBX5173396.1 SgcJ/EcaC family oxidoreductase [Rhizobium sp. NZLR1b]
MFNNTHLNPTRLAVMKKLMNFAGKTADAASAQSGIEEALLNYETALNASDTHNVMAVFAPDGVFMAPNNPSAVGTDAIRAAYNGIFQAITFDTELTVEEVVQVAPHWAFVRTNSKGHVTVNAIKQRVPDANHELFIFQKGTDDAWKIARYSFATTNPLP